MFTCPWDDEDFVNYLNIIVETVLSIITVTLASAVINSVFYLLSRGWNIAEFHMTRKMVTNVTFVFGADYVLQLAQQYSQGQDGGFTNVFILLLGGFYSAMLVICTLNFRTQQKVV
jgi:hypothetical protein